MMNNNVFSMINSFKNNPMAVIGKGFNVPQNLNNPNDIIQHLMNSGQVSQEQYNQVVDEAKRIGLIK